MVIFLLFTFAILIYMITSFVISHIESNTIEPFVQSALIIQMQNKIQQHAKKLNEYVSERLKIQKRFINSFALLRNSIGNIGDTVLKINKSDINDFEKNAKILKDDYAIKLSNKTSGKKLKNLLLNQFRLYQQSDTGETSEDKNEISEKNMKIIRFIFLHIRPSKSSRTRIRTIEKFQDDIYENVPSDVINITDYLYMMNTEVSDFYEISTSSQNDINQWLKELENVKEIELFQKLDTFSTSYIDFKDAKYTISSKFKNDWVTYFNKDVTYEKYNDRFDSYLKRNVTNLMYILDELN